MKSSILYFLFWVISAEAFAQPAHYTSENAHSHNDYEQTYPFYDAYARHYGSIEADLWAVKGKLMVAHSREDIREARTFAILYLSPLLSRLKANHGKAYANGQHLQLLIDLKSPYNEVLPLLQRLLKPYYRYFDWQNNADAVRLVISGNMPPPDSLHFFAPIFTFDGRIGNTYPPADLDRVVLVSDNVQKFVRWTKNHPLDSSGLRKLQHLVDSIHQQKKLIRFWATPNTVQAYRVLMKLGVDYIGSDQLQKLGRLLTRKKNLPLRLNRGNFHERSY